jgi:CubicO group peptidase (beta-lactamase class C family)
MRRLTVVLLFVLSTSAGAQSLPAPATVHHVADSLARSFVAEHGAPGIAVAMVRGKDTLLLAAYGMADLENDLPATARSVYRIGSITKQFTAAAVMQLIEAGKVKLDGPIGDYLPTLPDAWKPVTIRQLLNHTSGIPSYTGLGPVWAARWGEVMTPDTIVALTAAKPMDFAPGTSWSYNNSGYVILGMLIEKVTGKTWGDDLRARFAVPLGLEDTRDCRTEPLVPRRAHGYENKDGQWVNAKFLDMSQPFSAGALCSTVGDLIKWNRALHTGKVVSAESYRLMTTPEGAATKGARQYGFGLAVDTVAGRKSIAHGGGIHGFITANTWVPSAELSVTVLANSGSAKSGELARKLARVALGAPPESKSMTP